MLHFNVLRGVRGAVPAFTPVNFGAVGLFNNSNGPHLIKVWQFTSFVSPALAYVLNGRLTTQNVGVISPMVTGEAAPVGQLDKDDLAAAPAFDYTPIFAQGPAAGLGDPYPLAVLRPGWSFVLSTDTAAAKNYTAFIWEWCYAEDLFTPSAGDSDELP